MILKCLYDFARSRRLLDDLAFGRKPIRWIIQLDSEGNLIGSGPVDTSHDGRRGKKFSAPLTSRPKNAGGIGEFLADSLTGIWGLDAEPDNDAVNARNRRERANNAAKCEDFWRQVDEAFAETRHADLSALQSFRQKDGAQTSFLRWGVGEGLPPNEESAWWVKAATGEEVKLKGENFSFQVEGRLLLDNEELRDWWRKVYTQELSGRDEEAGRGLCLITGLDNVPIAATHPKIKGVRNAQTSGASLVSFDKAAFTSYGFEQSHNAPTSTEAATAYSVALNHLLANKNHSLSVGPMTACFWARNSEEATNVFVWAFEQPKPATVRDFLRSPIKGSQQALGEPDEFYSVTLSGNGGRVVVRHWMQMTVEAAQENLRGWFRDLEIAAYGSSPNGVKEKRIANKSSKANAEQADQAPKESTPPLALFRLAVTTVREAKDLQSDVPAQLYRAALEAIAPPLSLVTPILKRFEIDLVKNGPNIALRNLSRFALLRLILNRNRKDDDPMIEPRVFDTNDPAYNCGRLLAILDDLQMRAHEYQLEGAGVVERYYGSASSAPNSAFGILWRLHQHHLKKLARQGDRGRGAAGAIKRKIADIAALFRQPAPNLPPAFPRVFDLKEQGRFALGFYQQKAHDDAARRDHKRQTNTQDEQSNNNYQGMETTQ